MVFLSRWVWRGEGVGRGGEGFFGRREESFFLGERGEGGRGFEGGGVGEFFSGR